MPKRSPAIESNNVDGATALMQKLSVAPKEKSKASVLAERRENDPSPPLADPSLLVKSNGRTDDPTSFDDNAQADELLNDEKQLEYLEQMFDDQAREKMSVRLPDGVELRKKLLKTKLMPHQVQGVKWLLKQEMNTAPNPWFKEVTYRSGEVRYRCSLTGKTFVNAPTPIKGAILADDMGLGKTIQSLALILSNPPACKAKLDPFVTLIVAPKSAISNWPQQTEMHVKPGHLTTKVYEGQSREAMIRHIHNRKWNIVIVSYETLQADFKKFKKAEDDVNGLPPPLTLFSIHFHRVILDEAHTIRNPTTKMFHAALNVKADNKLALTGTPFVNSPTDIYSLLRFLNVEPLSDKTLFKDEVIDKIKNGRPCGLSRLRTVMMHVSLRRVKGTVDIVLPEKTTVLKRIPFKDDEHKRFHDSLYSIAKNCLRVLSTSEDPETKKAFNQYLFQIVLRVRQSCCSAYLFSEDFRCEVQKIAKDVENVSDEAWSVAKATGFLQAFSNESKHESGKKSSEKINNSEWSMSPKIKALLRLIQDEMEETEKGVVFSSFTSFLDLIGEAFNDSGVAFTRLDGTMTTAERSAAMTSFGKEDINPRFILCSLKAAGSGINLTRGSVCFLVDPWFNQASEDQAADRVHRVSQTRDVKIFRLVMQDSVEERLVSLQKAKKVLGKGAMEKLSLEEQAKTLELKTYKSLMEINDGDWCHEFEDDDSFIIDDDMSFDESCIHRK